MIDIKADFSGGLNLDDALYNVPKNAYIDAMNVTTDAIEGSNDRAITNIVGNRLVEYNSLPTVSLFSSQRSEWSEGGYTQTYITLTGTLIEGTEVVVKIKDDEGEVVVGTVTVEENDNIVSVYNRLAESLSESPEIQDVLVSPEGDYLRMQYEELVLGTKEVLINISLFNAGENICIGACPNNVRDTVIYFLYNSLGFHSVLEYNNSNRTISPIFVNLTDSENVDILDFKENKKITSINIYNRNPSFDEGDLLFFIDSLGRPTTMDIKKFKDRIYIPVTRDIIDVCKKPPLFPPASVYGVDNSRNSNNLRNRLFRFKYRYVYDNNERSVCSPISSVPLPINILNEEYNSEPSNNNTIDILLTTGDKDVKSIELLMSYVRGTNDWSDFALVENIDKNKVTLTASSNQQPNPEGDDLIGIITFRGAIIEGTVVRLFLTEFSPGFPQVQIAEYTIQAGDGMSELINGLVASSSIIPLTAEGTNSVKFFFGYPYFLNDNFSSITLPENTNLDNIEFSYSFYNDGTYPVIDVQESIQIFDYVPDLANAQEMANGNVLIYGGITEGYNRDLEPNVVNTIFTKAGGSPTGGLSYKIVSNSIGIVPSTVIEFSGIPLENTEIKIFGKRQSDGVIVQYATYTTANGDSLNKIALELKSSFLATYPSSFKDASVSGSSLLLVWGNLPPHVALFNNVTIALPDFDSTDNSIPTFLFSTTRRIGIAYFDKKGKTNGILYSGNLVFPDYDEEDDLVLVPYINTKIFHKPPMWAHSYGFYLTKETTQFLYWLSIGAQRDNSNEFIYFNITNLSENQKVNPTTTQVVSYTFQDGDRLRLIKKVGEDIFSADYDAAILGLVVDPIINPSTPTEGKFIKIKNLPPFDIVDLDDSSFIIQMYRPVQSLPSGENEVYYEFGQQYGIGNPETSLRYHLGMVQDQGRISDDIIKCTSFIVENPIIPNQNTAFLEFSGLPLVDTEIKIYLNLLPDTQIELASYTIQSTDNLESVVTELYNEMIAKIGLNLISVSRPEFNKINFIYDSEVYSFNAEDVEFTYPQSENVPAEFNFYEGDVYVRPRVASTNDGQSVFGSETYNCLDRNFLDDYISAVNSIDGRPSIIDVNARKAYYSTMVRFGQAYQPNTNINGLNRFFPANFDEYDYTYGDIMRLKVRDRFIRVFQKLKVGKVPLYSQIVKDPANVQNLIVSDKLINPIAYYVGDLGIGEHAESLVSYSYADYFTSNIKGIIARVGEEGVTFLSIDHKMDSWATSNLPLRTGNYKVYGGLDQRIGNYVIALEATPTDPATTLVFDLDFKCFSTFLSYHPEMMTTLGTLFISFKDGKLYTHDNFDEHNTFYGENTADSYITPVFNANPLDKKTFMSIAEVGSQIWDVPQIKTDLNSYGTTKMESNLVDADFNELEGSYEAPILRDINSIGGILEGDSMKGKYMTMKFRAKEPTSLVSLNLLSLKSINSPLNNR